MTKETSQEFWRTEARNERIGSIPTFVGALAFAGMTTALALNGDSVIDKLAAIPVSIVSWEAFKFGFSELREARQIAQKCVEPETL